MTTSTKAEVLPLAPGVPAQRNVGEHPLALYLLFFTEMWERFSYYGMRALLVYYMTKHILLDEWKDRVIGHAAIMGGLTKVFGVMDLDAQSSQIYGLYTAFVYLTPLAGGMIADRFIGQRKSVYIGGVIMATGQFVLTQDRFFYFGLLLLIIGNGFFKPNISTQVGALYPKGDERRDRAFMIFYVGINVGALLAPLVCGTLGEKVGWPYGFGAAGVGMILGLVLYTFAQKYLAPDNVMKKAAAAAEAKEEEKVEPFTKDEWGRILGLCTLCLLNVLFWGVYEQQGNTLAKWADKHTDRVLLGWEVPGSWLQAVNPSMIFAFTPLIIGFWKKQATQGKEPSSVAKMATGCGIMGVGYALMALAAIVSGGQGASVLWLVGATSLLTLGELYLSPVGLSLVTKVAPGRVVSMMMGMWFISSFLGNYLQGYLGTYWNKMEKSTFFFMLTGLSFLAAGSMLAVMVPLKKALGENRAPAGKGAGPAESAVNDEDEALKKVEAAE
ncbi:MAG: peptide MFS transporter [Labilithrix sp.]|nr:peptide MFS transporter [Labilithrix sp.]MCW5812725.1 peptide MFS transporter [Labilithrix sp.]